jgi:prophage regulatory protein
LKSMIVSFWGQKMTDNPNVQAAKSNFSLGSLRIIRLKEVIELTGISRSLIYLKVNARSRYFDPSFPRPLKIASRAIGWNGTELQKWIESRTP